MIRGNSDGPFRDNAADLRKHGDLRDMVKGQCAGCHNEWWAPVLGACPRCRGTVINELERMRLGAPRV